LLAVVPVLLVACGSDDEIDEARADLQEAQGAVQSLSQQIDDMQTEARAAKLARVGEVVAISEILDFEPAVIEVKQDSAVIGAVATVNTICTVAFGPTSDYGHLSTDVMMAPGGHKDHRHLLRGLQPNTVYHYKWGLVAPDGTVYSSKDNSFRTLPAQP
jgi:hypothetical protein